MKFLAFEVEAPGASAEAFRPLLEAESAQAWELYKSGLLRELYFRPDQHTAVLVLECGSEDEAQAALDSLPLAQAGLIHFDLIPLAPYIGFERLFKKNRRGSGGSNG